MRAKKCDRCGKLYEHYDGSKEFKNGEKANAFLLIDRDPDNKYWSRKSYDLCPECMKKMEEFIKGKDILEFLLDGNFREESFSIELSPGELMGTLELKGHTLKVYMGHVEGERLSFAGGSTVKRKFTIIEV